MTYTKRFFVRWGVRESRRYYMHAALRLARRMRARGHLVVVCQTQVQRVPAALD